MSASDVIWRIRSDVVRSAGWIRECGLNVVRFAVSRQILQAVFPPLRRPAYTPRERWPANTAALLRALRVLRGFPSGFWVPTRRSGGGSGFLCPVPPHPVPLPRRGEKTMSPATCCPSAPLRLCASALSSSLPLLGEPLCAFAAWRLCVEKNRPRGDTAATTSPRRTCNAPRPGRGPRRRIAGRPGWRPRARRRGRTPR
jgi:hypothetical protein